MFFNSNFAPSTLFKLLLPLIESFYLYNGEQNNFAENLGEPVESNKINEEQKTVSSLILEFLGAVGVM